MSKGGLLFDFISLAVLAALIALFLITGWPK
jgi:hypothetical protein